MKGKRKYGLLEGDWERIAAIFRGRSKIEKAILFGSRAKGDFAPGSDVDIALEGYLLNLDDLLYIKTEIEKLALPYKFDIVLFNRIREKDLIDHIERVGKVLFDQKAMPALKIPGQVGEDTPADYGHKK